MDAKGKSLVPPVEPTNEITLWGVRKIVDEALRKFTALHIAGLEQIQDADGSLGGATKGAPQFKLIVAGGASGQMLRDLGDALEKGLAKAGPPKWARWAHVTVGGPMGSGQDERFEFILHLPPGVFVKKFWKEEANVNDMRSWIDRCAGIEVAAVAEAVRPLGGLDLAAADDEVQIHFESAADAQLVYDFLIGAGTGVRLLEPGEVQLRVIEGWDQCTVAFAPHVRYLKPEIIAAVIEAYSDRIHEAAWDAAQRDLAEEVQALQEFNPYHDKQGNFGSKAGLAAAKAGSYSKGSRKNKVSGKTKKGLKLVATKLPCGRDARDSGRNQRCWDGAKLDWTGQAAARVLKKAKAQGKIHDAVTAYDRAILERAARALDARAAMMDEAAGAKKLRTAVSMAYNKYFENVPVDIFAIGKIGKEIEALIVAGKDLDAEMPAIVKKYRKEESDGRSVRDLLSELGGQTFGGRRVGRDPYWMAAKYAGKDKNGTPFRKGDQVFYYPNTKTVLAGDAAEKAAAEFQGAKDDERQYNYGME